MVGGSSNPAPLGKLTNPRPRLLGASRAKSPSPRLVAMVRGEAGAVAVEVWAVDVAVVKRGAGEALHLD